MRIVSVNLLVTQSGHCPSHGVAGLVIQKWLAVAELEELAAEEELVVVETFSLATAG